MKFVKKTFLSILVTLSLLSSSIGVFAAPGTNFSDIAGSKYESDIVSLESRSIVSGYDNSNFNPEKALTKAEMATLISKAFLVAPIETYKFEGSESIDKKVVYDINADVVTEEFVVAAAKDTENTWASGAVEGLINARISSAENNKFNPNTNATSKEFFDTLLKAVYGADSTKKVEDLVTDGLLKEAPVTTGEISREYASHVINQIVSNESFKIITIFATSDIHGNLIPYKPSGSEVKIGSLDKMAKIINDYRKIQPDLLLVDAGDAPYNSNIANLFEGKSVIDTMNAMKYDATVLGNHDFDYSLSTLLSNAKRANHAFLSANTYYRTGEFPEEFKEYIIKEVDGVKIGILGITDHNSAATTHYDNTIDIEFKDHYETLEKFVPILKEKTDIIVFLSHCHNHNYILPEKTSGVDIEIGGGNDLMGPPKIVNGTYIINPGKHAECLNQINVSVLNNEMIGLNHNQIVIHENLQADPEVTEVIQGYVDKMEVALEEVVGQTTVDLDGERKTTRGKESNLGNAVADSQREFFNADIALQNGGGVRASIATGEITKGDIFEAVPFDNKMLVIEVSGKTVWEALENGVAGYVSGGNVGGAGQFLQVSGISYVADISKPIGERVTDVKMADGTVIDLEKRYQVVINDFMAGGGDGFTMLKCKGEGEYAKDVKIVLETSDFIRDMFATYIVKNSPISPKEEGRITIKNIPTGN